MKVGQLFAKKGYEIFSVGPAQPLTDAIDIMMRQRIGSLAVIENGRLVSIITERDVMRAVHSHLAGFTRVRVADFMAPMLVCCKADDSLDQAMDLMFNNETGRRVRHLPVTEDERLVGIISIGDIVQALLTEVEFENRLLRNYIKNWPEEAPSRM